MVDQCSLCEKPREPHSEYCRLHEAALTNLEAQYANWLTAFGGVLSKDEYFSKLLSLSETGDAVKRLITRNKANAVSQ
jgi:hypothetical protein